MTWLRVLLVRFGDLFGRGSSERELEAEIDEHVAVLAEEHVRTGTPREAAYRTARLKLGGMEQTKEAFRDVRRLPVIETIWQDVRYATRVLARTPAFTLAALVTLALGIGGTTAIFSVVNAVLFKPLPYHEPDRLLVLTRAGGFDNISGRVLHYVRDHVRSFERVAAEGGGGGWNLVTGRDAEHVNVQRVSEEYFALHGIAPLAGREFTSVESQPDGPRVVILGEALWRRRFGARPGVIGEVVQLGGIPHTVVGVAPSRPATIADPDVWTPLQVSRTDDGLNYTVLGRLRPGVSIDEGQSELDALRSSMARDFGESSEAARVSLAWMRYQDMLGQGQRRALLTLLGAVGFLLLIACANVASLQLVRASARRREMATRSALGGDASRLTQQVLTESVLLASAGGILGLIVAHWGVRSVLALAPEDLAFGQEVGLDWRVLLAALMMALGTGLLFGMAPAVDARRADPRPALWESGARHTAGRRAAALRRLFVVTEVALAVILLVGAGLLIRTFVNLQGVPLGFEPHHVLTAKMSLSGSNEQVSEPVPVFFERVLDRIRQLPGAEVAAVGNYLPVERGYNYPLDPPAGGIVDRMSAVDWRWVTPDYFSVFRIPLRDGRLFDERETAGGAPVAIVNEAFAQTYFGRSQVVGERIQLGRAYFDEPPREIVGVVNDVKSRPGSGWTSGRNALAAPAPPIMYVPLAQADVDGEVSWAIRTRRADASLVPALQAIVRGAQPTLPFISFRTMEDVIAAEVVTERFHMTLVGIFASVAILLAAIGIYGLIAYSVSQRTQEVGVRLALGAPPLSVLMHFVREGLVLALIGAAVGLLGAAFVAQALESLLWGVQPLDPLTFAAVAGVLVVIATVASFAPAFRAARINPTLALRQ